MTSKELLDIIGYVVSVETIDKKTFEGVFTSIESHFDSPSGFDEVELLCKTKENAELFEIGIPVPEISHIGVLKTPSEFYLHSERAEQYIRKLIDFTVN